MAQQLHVSVCRTEQVLTGLLGEFVGEDVTRLFEPYWKGREMGRKGIGLSLYITRAIVHAHGGKLSAESKLGVGSLARGR